MIKKFRLYGDAINRWFSEDENGHKHLTQIEVPYKEYDEYGNIVATGTEDFSPDRYGSTIRTAWAWVWDGEKRNAAGQRWFRCLGMIRYRKTDARLVKLHLRHSYNAAVLDLR